MTTEVSWYMDPLLRDAHRMDGSMTARLCLCADVSWMKFYKSYTCICLILWKREDDFIWKCLLLNITKLIEGCCCQLDYLYYVVDTIWLVKYMCTLYSSFAVGFFFFSNSKELLCWVISKWANVHNSFFCRYGWRRNYDPFSMSHWILS